MARLTKKISTTVKLKTYQNVENYIAKNQGETKASVVNRALENFFAIEGGVEEIDFISNRVNESVKENLKPFEERICKLIAKLAKGNYTNLYMLLNMLEELSANEAAKTRINDNLNLANKKAYEAVKKNYIDNDILELFDNNDKNK